MKALSIRQPWAHLVVKGIKRIENRTWATNYRGPLLIHAANYWHAIPIEEIEARFRVRIPRDLPRGAIVGRVELVDIVTQSRDRFFEGPYGFVLRCAEELEPVTMKGRRFLFEIV